MSAVGCYIPVSIQACRLLEERRQLELVSHVAGADSHVSSLDNCN